MDDDPCWPALDGCISSSARAFLLFFYTLMNSKWRGRIANGVAEL